MKITCMSIHEAYSILKPMRHFKMRCNSMIVSNTSINAPKLLSLPKSRLKATDMTLSHLLPRLKNLDIGCEGHLKLIFTRIILPETVVITIS